MVYSVERRERLRGGDYDDEEGLLVMERSKLPLHNFNFPLLKWGNQKHLRCMKAPESAAAVAEGDQGYDCDRRLSIVSAVASDRRWRNRSPPSMFGGVGNYDVRRLRRPRFGGGEEGINTVREKLILDRKTQMVRMKNRILKRNELSDDDDSDKEEEDEQRGRKLQASSQSPPPSLVAVVAEESSQEELRPWNLRTRRAACRAPTLFGGNLVTGKGLRIEKKGNNNNNSPLRSDIAKSPRLRGEKREREGKEKEKERVKFSRGLAKKEIEEDFMQMVGHRPARRPKKRSRMVQNQLDTLFPGLWLTEVTVDAYKVLELPDSGKR